MKKPENEPSEWNVRPQQERLWKTTAFCFAHVPTNVHPFTTRLVEYCKQLGVGNPISELKKISEKDNIYLTDNLVKQYAARQKNGHDISLQSISDFRASFDALYENGVLESDAPLQDGLTHVNNILYFVYLVRCSVFHGRKQLTVARFGRDQDMRLAIYAAAVMAINQVVIERAQQQLR